MIKLQKLKIQKAYVYRMVVGHSTVRCSSNEALMTQSDGETHYFNSMRIIEQFTFPHSIHDISRIGTATSYKK